LNDSGSKIRSIACSDDGQKIILCRSDGNYDGETNTVTYFGAVYISENGGVTWGKHKESLITISDDDDTSPNNRYDSVAINVKSNEDGTTSTVYAVTCGSEKNVTDGKIFISRDSGANWVEKSLPKNTDIYNNPAYMIGKDRNYSVAIDTDQNIFVSNFSGNIKCFYYNDGTLEERWSTNITPTNPNQFCTTASLTLSNHADGKLYLAFTEYGRTLLSEGITDISSAPSFNVTGSTNEFRNLSMTGTKLFGTYEVAVATSYDEYDNPLTYQYDPHLIEGSITGGFSGSTTPEYEISFSGVAPDGDGVDGAVPP